MNIKTLLHSTAVQNVLLACLSLAITAVLLVNFFSDQSPEEARAVRDLNMSWFVYRDVNRSGTYDGPDRPYPGFLVRLDRPDGSSVEAKSNINGFANFKMALDPEIGDISEAGRYQFVAPMPEGWQATSGNGTVEVEFERLPGSPAGIIAKPVPVPLGIAPDPTIRGHIGQGDGDQTYSATDPSGKTTPIAPDDNGAFQLTGAPGVWSITSKSAGSGTLRTANLRVGYYPVVLSRYFLASAPRDEAGRLRTIGYDDLTSAARVYKLPNGYNGLNWKDLNAIQHLFARGPGYINSTVSSDYIAYSSSGHPGFITSDTPFDFVSSYIGVGWPKAEDGLVRVEGYRGGSLVYEDAIKVSHRAPVLFHADYRDITKLIIYSDTYWQVTLDDTTVRLRQ